MSSASSRECHRCSTASSTEFECSQSSADPIVGHEGEADQGESADQSSQQPRAQQNGVRQEQRGHPHGCGESSSCSPPPASPGRRKQQRISRLCARSEVVRERLRRAAAHAKDLEDMIEKQRLSLLERAREKSSGAVWVKLVRCAELHAPAGHAELLLLRPEDQLRDILFAIQTTHAMHPSRLCDTVVWVGEPGGYPIPAGRSVLESHCLGHFDALFWDRVDLNSPAILAAETPVFIPDFEVVGSAIQNDIDQGVRKASETFTLGYSDFLQAVRGNNVEAVKEMASRNTEHLSEMTLGGETGLDLASFGGSSQMVNTLLELGAPANEPNPFTGVLPLYAAMANMDWRVVETLLEHGADPNLRMDGMHMLLGYVVGGNLEGLRALIAGGADVSDAQRGHLLISQTMQSRKFDMLRLLLAAGANPSIEVLDHISCSQYDEDDEEQRVVPLIQALQRGLSPTVRELLAFGADPNQVQRLQLCSHVSLEPAIIANDLEMIQCLLDAGADPNPQKTRPLISLAVAENCNEAVIEKLLQAGALIDSKDRHGRSALGLAIRAQNVSKTAFLLKKGAKLAMAEDVWRAMLPSLSTEMRELLWANGAKIAI